MKTLTNTQKINLLYEFMESYFNVYTANGDLDLDKSQKNVAYATGFAFTEINCLILEENIKLAKIKEELVDIKSIAYDELKRSVMLFDIKATDNMLKEHKKVKPKQFEYDDQKAYINNLKQLLSKLGNYSAHIHNKIQEEYTRERFC